MLLNRRLLRLGAWLATSSLCLTTAAPALAQPAAPQGTDQAGDQGTDPPALAGRLAAITGSVSFHNAGETQWSAATLNYPVTNGESFWTEPQAGATLEIADDRVVLDDSTELDITALDQSQLTATEPQGAIFLQLNSLPSAQGVSFDTPRGTVQITAIGRYEIVAGDTNNATTVSVVEGAAHVSGTGLSLDIGPQQTATIGGSDTLQGNVGPLQQDSFLQAQLGTPAPRRVAALPRATRYMTGAADLQQYGSFSQNAQYGQVWYPNDVASDWAPYRDGHWAYVQPWGWTWVDNARWGFAPFHYGRWVQVDDRWGWVAGGESADYGGADYGNGGGYWNAGYGGGYPVYSPALVTFVDVGGAALAGAAIGFAAGELAGGYAPAWIPLGPREPYYPWYHTRGDYFARVNRPYGVPRDIIARGPTYINNVNIHNTNIFINRRAATVSPAGAFARGEGLRGIARPLPERALAEARPVGGRLAVRPTAFTPNLAPAAARRFNVALPAKPVRPVAAGPSIAPATPGRAGPGRAGPALRHAAAPGNIHAVPAAQVQGRPGAPERVGAGRQPVEGRQPAGGTPPLRGPQNGAAPHPGAPGPAIGPRGEAGLPHLRAPGSRPEAVPPGGAPLNPQHRGPGEAATRPAPVGVTPREPAGSRPGAAAGPQPIGPQTRPGPASRQETRPETRQEARPGAAAPRPAPSAETPHPAPRPAPSEAARPGPHAEAPRPPRVEAPHPAPRPEAPHPAPRAEAPRPAPRVEAPRPAPRVEAPRPAPRVEAPRPAPRVEAPRPAPRVEAPRPAPRMEAPRPPPAPRPAPPPRPQPAPHPAPAPHPQPGQRPPH